MSRNKAIILYLAGAWGQICFVCLVVFLLRNIGIEVDYTSPLVSPMGNCSFKQI